ncbi:MAG TPA: hypothetical protein VH092_07910, partial [Urbifossiella sp.]|nr:hypothetical protein [Urbifossiella sp.]
MHSPAAALAWELWWRHRWGLTGAAAVVGGFAAYGAATPMSAQFAAVSSIWFMMAAAYAIGVFAYGFEARLDAAESGFPARFFVLPVRTRVLVGWPMLQGVTTAVLMWLVWDGLVLRPAGVTTPGWWAAILAAAVAVSQALVWLPFGVPWLRLVVMVAVLIAFVRAPAVLALAGDRFTGPEAEKTALIGIAAALLPAAFLVATAGVARARRGDNPGRAWAVPMPGRAGGGRERSPFASAIQAQVWYEWRLRGRGYVVTVAVVVAVLVAVGLLLEHRSNRGNFGLIFPFIPPLIAAFWGSAMGSPGESIRSSALTLFAATRPLGNATLVRAKFRAATRAAAAAWVIVLLVTVVWVAFAEDFGR